MSGIRGAACEEGTGDPGALMKSTSESSTQEVLAGLVERVTFHNAESGFCVLRAKARGHRDLVTVVGHAAIISAGEWITASGEWINDRAHGQQFKARFLKTSAPSSIDGIEKYLGSGMIRGIGPTLTTEPQSNVERYDADAAKTLWRRVADQLRPKLPKLAAFMDEAEDDVLAYMGFPPEHWLKIHSTNGLDRLNGEIKRRTDVVGIFPNDEAIVRLVGAILLEQNDEWAVQRARYMTRETMAALSDVAIVRLPAMVI